MQQRDSHEGHSFRSDINGLRAIAVLIVVLYHMGQSDWAGGFVGVDVFFVISGFLIIPRVYAELLDGNFSISSFLAKRVRRLVPALLPVLAYSLIVGALLFGPGAFDELLNSVAAASAFVSNYLFAFTRGYFERSTDRMLLLHTWSLGVEFQFYLLAPLVLLAFRKTCLWVLALLIVSSLALSVFWTQADSNHAYYDVLSRFWQLGVGGLAGIFQRQIQSLLTSKSAWIVRLAGITLVLSSAVTFSSASPYPGLLSILPIMGALLVIIAPSTKRDPLLFILTSRPMGWLGLRSYSIYLWHWPLILTANLGFGEASDEKRTIAVLIAFIFAEFSYRNLEVPVQRNFWWKTKIRTIALLFLPLILMSGLVFVSQSTNSVSTFRSHLPMEEIRKKNGIADPARHAYMEKMTAFGTNGENGLCSLDEHHDTAGAAACLSQLGASAKTLFIGDSHGRDLLWVFQAAFPSHTFHMLHQSSCAPAEYGKCFPKLNGELLNLLDSGKYENVVLVSFWPSSAIESVKTTLSDLSDANVNVYVVGASPVFAKDIAQIVFPSEKLATETIPLKLVSSNFRVDPYVLNDSIEDLSTKFNVNFVDRLSVLCPDKQCLSFVPSSDDLMYFDNQHLTLNGVEYVASRFRTQAKLKRSFQ